MYKELLNKKKKKYWLLKEFKWINETLNDEWVSVRVI